MIVQELNDQEWLYVAALYVSFWRHRIHVYYAHYSYSQLEVFLLKQEKKANFIKSMPQYVLKPTFD